MRETRRRWFLTEKAALIRRVLGKKTLENAILEEVVKCAAEKIGSALACDGDLTTSKSNATRVKP